MYNEYFFVLDALRADHIKYMPWLNKKTEEGVFSNNYSISEGFCERIEIFTNTKPIDLGFITAMTISENPKFIYPYKWLSPRLARYLALIEFNSFFTKILRRILWNVSRIFSNFSIYPQRIPLNILHKIAITEDSYDFESLSIKNKKGLLYNLHKLGFKVKWDLFTSLISKNNMDDNLRLKKLLSFKNETKLFIPIYIALPDKVGHQYGPHSQKLIDSLLEIDKKIEIIVRELFKSNPKSAVTIIGDHGMESVTTTINMDKILNDIEITTGKKRFVDFDFFLDSTLMRIWWNNNSNNKNFFFKKLRSHDKLKKRGRFFYSNNIKENNFNNIADFIWWANKGVLISPNFFHNSKVRLKGMHGYLDKDNPSNGFCLRLKKDIKNIKIDKIKSGSIFKIF